MAAIGTTAILANIAVDSFANQSAGVLAASINAMMARRIGSDRFGHATMIRDSSGSISGGLVQAEVQAGESGCCKSLAGDRVAKSGVRISNPSVGGSNPSGRNDLGRMAPQMYLGAFFWGLLQLMVVVASRLIFCRVST
jgi:hypothetical protein